MPYNHTTGPNCQACQAIDEMADRFAKAMRDGLDVVNEAWSKEMTPADLGAALLAGASRLLRERGLLGEAFPVAVDFINAELREEKSDLKGAAAARAARALN